MENRCGLSRLWLNSRYSKRAFALFSLKFPEPQQTLFLDLGIWTPAQVEMSPATPFFFCFFFWSINDSWERRGKRHQDQANHWKSRTPCICSLSIIYCMCMFCRRLSTLSGFGRNSAVCCWPIFRSDFVQEDFPALSEREHMEEGLQNAVNPA